MIDYESFFDNMTDEEFEQFLIEGGFNFKKVEKGKGGVSYKGKLYKTYEELEKAWQDELKKNSNK